MPEPFSVGRPTQPPHTSRAQSHPGDTHPRHDKRPRHDVAPPQQDEPQQRRKFTSASRIFVYGLRSDVTKEDLKVIFTEYGEVQDIYRPESKNFAFVRMDHPEHSLRAIEELQGRNMFGDGAGGQQHPMRLRVAVSNTAVWVGDLPVGTDNGSLSKAFAVFGEVERAIVASDVGGAQLSFGHVWFTSRREARVCAAVGAAVLGSI